MESLRVQTESVMSQLMSRCNLLEKKLNLANQENLEIKQVNDDLEKKISGQSRTINELTGRLATIDAKFKECELRNRTLSGNVGGLNNLNLKLNKSNVELNNQIAVLTSKAEKAKAKLENLKVRQEVFKGGRSTSPSDVIYRGKKFIRGKLMKQQATKEQKARNDAREMFLRGIGNPVHPPAFADKKYYSTSPAIRRFMRKVKDDTSDEKLAKAVRDAYRKARRAKRYELTPTLQK